MPLKALFLVRKSYTPVVPIANTCSIGYPHDGRADNAAYRHDRRADNVAYRHDRRADSLSREKCVGYESCMTVMPISRVIQSN